MKRTYKHDKSFVLELKYKDKFDYSLLIERQIDPAKIDISITGDTGIYVPQPIDSMKDDTPEIIAETMIQRFIEGYIKGLGAHGGMP